MPARENREGPKTKGEREKQRGVKRKSGEERGGGRMASESHSVLSREKKRAFAKLKCAVQQALIMFHQSLAHDEFSTCKVPENLGNGAFTRPSGYDASD